MRLGSFIAAGLVAIAAVHAVRSGDAGAVEAADPPRAVLVGNVAGAAALTKAEDGHFWADARVNGAQVRVMVDTGATAVALTPYDARRVGLDPDVLVYDAPINTAAGPAHAAVASLERISIAGIEARNVEAIVVPEGLSHSLLGMSYLERLSRIEVTRDTLILRR